MMDTTDAFNVAEYQRGYHHATVDMDSNPLFELREDVRRRTVATDYDLGYATAIGVAYERALAL